MTNGKILRVNNVSKSFLVGGFEVFALRDASLEVAQGDFVAICGRSGSGKTTLLNLVGCLALPTRGHIFIGDREIHRMSDRELSAFRSDHLGFVFQHFSLLSVLTARENVEYALLGRKMSSSSCRRLALEALKKVGLEDCSNRRPDQLSGGQRQRVALARAFVRQPDLIIADEPTASLDRGTAGEILDLLVKLNRETGSTVLIATHDQAAMERARQRIDMADGELKKCA